MWAGRRRWVIEGGVMLVAGECRWERGMWWRRVEMVAESRRKRLLWRRVGEEKSCFLFSLFNLVAGFDV